MKLVPVLLLAALMGSTVRAEPVTFQVDMGVQIERGLFDPAAESVDVAGSFNGWGTTPTPLADPDGDAVYEATVDGFAVGQTLAFKFRLGGRWDGREEFPGVGNDRTYTVTAGPNVVRAWYNDERPATGPPVAAFGASPRVVVAGGLVHFEDRSGGAVTGWRWAFEGGTPGTETHREATVRYAEPGTYDVTLVVAGPDGRDSLTVRDHVEVRPRPSDEAAWWHDAVFYEVFVRSFADSDGDGVGDFNGLTDRLDYLNDGDPTTTDDLGVTGLWLMPVHPSPSTHGYDVTDYRAVNPEYGTAADFRRLLDEAHARGVRVVVDFVMNHSSSEHPWFRASERGEAPYRDFYRWSETDPGHRGPWGQDVWHRGARGHYYGLFWGGMPDLNYGAPAVRDSLFAAAEFWLRDVGVDGFRLDAVKYLFEDGSTLEDLPATHAFWGDFNDHVRRAAPEAYTVCEAWTATAGVVPYVADGRFGQCFEFDLASALLGALATGDARGLAARAQEVYGAYLGPGYATFLTNHDQDRVFGVLGEDERRARAAAAVLLTLPGTPFLYYGEEVGLTGRNDDGTNRRPMQWSAGPNAGFTTGAPWFPVDPGYAARNVAVAEGDPGSLLHWYRTFVGLRNGHAALRTGEYYPVASSSPAVFAFVRADEAERVLVVVNTGATPVGAVRLGLPLEVVPAGPHRLADLLDPDHPLVVEVDGAGEVANVSAGPYGVHVYAFADAPTPAEGAPPPGPPLALGPNWPNPAGRSTTVSLVLPAPGPATLEVFNALGQRVWAADLAPVPGPQTVEVALSGLAAGAYAYRLRQGDHHVTRWLTVAR